ncbi:MAG TPA: hypothetical protein PLJ00_15295 [Chitinophagales bacterium]|nr:hypothetical protein [Chitinophagales bacterium]HRG85995.1 hypothetical protein [Chitinophagales bacterium]HRH53801.1 hypothetical protein [Chitinophagales bacterium]
MVNRFVYKPNNQDIYFFLGLLFTIYLTIRAIVIPITIDEAGTYYNYMPRSVTDILLFNGDPSPNNHILNTLSMKLFTALFGTTTFVVRLPNVLGFILFYTAAVRLFTLMFKNRSLVVAALLVLLCNPYLLDFFAVARGYGLSIAFMFWSLYQFFQYYNTKKNQFAVTTLIAAALAVLANFTLLHFYILIFFVIVVIAFAINLNKWKHLLIYVSITLILAAICYTPLTKMMQTNQLVYWETAGFYISTLVPLVEQMRYGELYFGYKQAQPFANLILLIFWLMIFVAVFYFFKKPNGKQLPFGSWILILLSGNICFILIQFYLWHVPFLNGRGALFLYPIFVLALLALLQELMTNSFKFPKYILLILAGMGIIHISQTANTTSTREWWFDAHTKEVLAWINQQHPGKENVSLNSSWIFNNSLHFHKDVQQFYNLDIAPYHQDLWPDSNYLYYYCQREEVSKLDSTYNEVKSFNYGSFVIMKKSN